MKKMKKLLALGIALAMTATVFAGCGNKAAGSDAKDGNTLVYGSRITQRSIRRCMSTAKSTCFCLLA